MTLFNFSIPPRPPLSLDAKFDMEGFGNTLAVRAEIEAKPGSCRPIRTSTSARCYYQRAMAALRR